MSEPKFKTAVLKRKFEKARALVDKGWTQGKYACDSSHNIVSVRSRTAKCWCMTGALILVSGAMYGPNTYTRIVPNDLILLLCEILVEVTGIKNLVFFNDVIAKDKRYVLRKFDKVIKWLDAYEHKWFTPPDTWREKYD